MAASETLKIVTPRGEAQWACLDRSETYMGAETGKYGIGILLKGEALEKMVKIVDTFVEENTTAKQRKSYVSPFKSKDGVDGMVLKCTAPTKTKAGKVIRIPVVDATGAVIKNPPAIGNGSIIRLSLRLGIYEAQGKVGVRRSLQAVKLLKLVEYDSTGFGDADAEEDADFADAYVAPKGGFDPNSDENSPEDAEEGSDDGDVDF